MMTNKIKLQTLQLMRSIENTIFFRAYKKLITNNHQKLNENEKHLLLKFSVIFLNYGERELEKFGYKIILRYSNLFGEYKPLYDISINKGYIPVAKFIEDKYFNSEVLSKSFSKLWASAYKNNFKHSKNDRDIYFSAGQKRLYAFSKNENNFIIVAPTSYGKSELIIQKVEDNLDKNICIIVPTKSLLSQTRKNLISNSIIRRSKKRIITHPDMLNNISGNIFAVLTQERLLRLLQKHTNLNFDIVLIDEAHNLIEKNPREILTIQDLKILKKRNLNTKFYYFTPFLVDPINLMVFPNEKILTDKIQEFIKIERYYSIDLTSNEKLLKIYDQFLNKFFKIKNFKDIDSPFEFISKFAAKKNIIYLNRPQHIEKFSISVKNGIKTNNKIQKIQKALGEFLHKDYNLIETIQNGVVYHHGGMPENIRLYVENAFSEIDEIEYIVTSSTLLQGVNIPAEKMFLLDTKKGRGNLNASQFKNLSGRICRFSEIFKRDTGELKLLEPEIFIVKSNFSSKAANIDQFLIKRVKDNVVISDKVDNPLIKKNLEELSDEEAVVANDAEEFQENIEEGSSDLENLRVVSSQIAKACFKNNIHDFDIFENEKQLEENYFKFKEIDPVSTSENLIFLIAKIFLFRIELRSSNTDNFKRLEYDKAKSFYAMILGWRCAGASYNIMINNFLWYWSNKKKDTYIYVGTRWGEITSPYRDGSRKIYIDLSTKTEKQKINIAILRIKEEQDFIDYKLMPYIEILNDLKLIEPSFYDRIKYGTNNEKMIFMLKEGFSIELARLIISSENYSKYVEMSNDIKINNGIIKEMEEDSVNEILIFEIKYYVS